MSSPRRFVRVLVTFACVLLSAAALRNVFEDNSELVRRAGGETCGDSSFVIVRAERTPFAQTFDFRAPKRGDCSVRCARSSIAIGDYACTKR